MYNAFNSVFLFLIDLFCYSIDTINITIFINYNNNFEQVHRKLTKKWTHTYIIVFYIVITSVIEI